MESNHRRNALTLSLLGHSSPTLQRRRNEGGKSFNRWSPTQCEQNSERWAVVFRVRRSLYHNHLRNFPEILYEQQHPPSRPSLSPLAPAFDGIGVGGWVEAHRGWGFAGRSVNAAPNIAALLVIPESEMYLYKGSRSAVQPVYFGA